MGWCTLYISATLVRSQRCPGSSLEGGSSLLPTEPKRISLKAYKEVFGNFPPSFSPPSSGSGSMARTENLRRRPVDLLESSAANSLHQRRPTHVRRSPNTKLRRSWPTDLDRVLGCFHTMSTPSKFGRIEFFCCLGLNNLPGVRM